MKAEDYASEQPQGTHVLTVMEGYADIKAIEFAEWVSRQISLCTIVYFSDNKWYYNNKVIKTPELLEAFKLQQNG